MGLLRSAVLVGSAALAMVGSPSVAQQAPLLGSATQIWVEMLLKQAGMSPKDVTFIGVGINASAIAAFQQKIVDVMVVYPPTFIHANASCQPRRTCPFEIAQARFAQIPMDAGGQPTKNTHKRTGHDKRRASGEPQECQHAVRPTRALPRRAPPARHPAAVQPPDRQSMGGQRGPAPAGHSPGDWPSFRLAGRRRRHRDQCCRARRARRTGWPRAPHWMAAGDAPPPPSGAD